MIMVITPMPNPRIDFYTEDFLEQNPRLKRRLEAWEAAGGSQ